MAITLVDSQTGTVNANVESITVTPALTVVEGDFLAVGFFFNGELTDKPDGWESLAVGGRQLSSGLQARQFYVLYKLAGASEPASYTFTVSVDTNGAWSYAHYRADSGVIRVDNGWDGTAQNFERPFAIPGFTPRVAGKAVAFFGGFATSGWAGNPPGTVSSGWTLQEIENGGTYLTAIMDKDDAVNEGVAFSGPTLTPVTAQNMNSAFGFCVVLTEVELNHSAWVPSGRSTGSTSGGTTLSLVRPPGLATNDKLVLFYVNRGGSGTPTFPPGFTNVYDQATSGGGRIRIFYKNVTDVDTEPANYNITTSSGWFEHAALYRIPGASGWNVSANGAVENTPSDAGTIPAISSTYQNAIAFAVILTNGTSPANARLDDSNIAVNLSVLSSSQIKTHIYLRRRIEPGSFSALDYTLTGIASRHIGVQVLIEPPEALIWGPVIHRAETSFGAVAGLAATPVTGAHRAAIDFGAVAGFQPSALVTVPAQVGASFGAITGVYFSVGDVAEVEIALGALAGFVANPEVLNRVRISFGAITSLDADIESAARLAARFGSVAGFDSSLLLHGIVAVSFGAAAGFRENYIGPGTGVVTRPSLDPAIIGMLDPTAHLREGDYQQAILPWRGVAGESGIIRILAMTVSDERRVPEFTDVEFSRTPDPASVRVLGRSGRVRKTIDQNTFASRMRRSDRER